MNKESICIIIGGQRCGTTFLYKLLDSHPEITMIKPLKPEPKLFLRRLSNKKYDEFFAAFSKAEHKRVKVIGEKSTSYYENIEVAENIKNYSNDAKILFILRNPVERALSNYFFSFDNGLEVRSLDDVFLNKIPLPKLPHKTSVSPFAYLERGEYSRFIIPYSRIFKDHMKIIIFEELISDKNLIKEIYTFLDVSPDYIPSNWKKVNNSNRLPDAAINPKVRSYLENYYRKEISTIEDILNRNLYHWNYD